MEVREILGLDVGFKRTGIARASNIAKLAEPLTTITTESVHEFIADYTKDHQVEAIAIGLPRSLSSEDTKQTEWVRGWVDSAKSKLDTPLYWQDEALTSIEADKIKHALHKGDNDSIAAAVILQDFLNTSELARIMC